MELLERDVIESNPVAYVLDETEFDHDDPNKSDLTVDEIGKYLRAIPNLQQRAMGVMFAKTGMRLERTTISTSHSCISTTKSTTPFSISTT